MCGRQTSFGGHRGYVGQAFSETAACVIFRVELVLTKLVALGKKCKNNTDPYIADALGCIWENG